MQDAGYNFTEEEFEAATAQILESESPNSRRGNNPYCHHRALVQAKRGMRELKTIRCTLLPIVSNGLIIGRKNLNLLTPWQDEVQ